MITATTKKSLNQITTSCQTSIDTRQEKRKCSFDSVSSWKKVQKGELVKPNRNSFSLLYTIQFNILY